MKPQEHSILKNSNVSGILADTNVKKVFVGRSTMPPLAEIKEHKQIPSSLFNSDESVFSGDKTAFLVQEEQAFMDNLK